MDKQKEIEKMAADLDKAKELALGTVGSLNNGFGGWYAKCLVGKGYGDVREAEHRAEVAERALSNELVQQGIRIGVFDVRTWYYQALERAEKELAEEENEKET